MFEIRKITSNHVIDFAAEELKKYLRMMMPECGEIAITYNPKPASGAFCLGLMQDFRLDVSDVEETDLDDIIYIYTGEKQGIIAGSNPRSVLISVYEFLRKQGCRFLMPGIDGELVPIIAGLTPVRHRFVPSCRYRGWCNEGSEVQYNMVEAIDFAPKVGMNIFMLEFRIPTSYYNRHYDHMFNDSREPESLTFDTILQYKRHTETEIAKRGLQFHDIGHGWSADPFGIDSSVRRNAQTPTKNDDAITPEQRQYLAMMKGERKLVFDTPNYTNFCMSNVEARKKVVDYAVRHAKKTTHADYIHFWLGDASNNHCECENCRKKTPSDWYVILLNELDRALTAEKLNTRIVFISYVDTVWAPLEERIENQKRFSCLLAPISRRYTESLPKERSKVELRPFKLNENVLPANLEESFAYFDEWRRMWKGANLAYEYHFWFHQYRDLSGLAISKIINEDIKSYKEYGINGTIEDGSQRSFFPNGFAFYTYARTLYDTSLSYEEIAEEYFSGAYGDNWRDFYSYLEKLRDLVPDKFFQGEASSDKEVGLYYNPELAENMLKAEKVIDEGMALMKAHYNSPDRVRTVSVRLLYQHAEYCKYLVKAAYHKCLGEDKEARELYSAMRADFEKREIYIERYYDHCLIVHALNPVFNSTSKVKKTEILAGS